LKHGFGKITYPSGNYYEGEWAFDKKQGQGTMYWADADEKVTNYHQDDFFNLTFSIREAGLIISRKVGEFIFG